MHIYQEVEWPFQIITKVHRQCVVKHGRAIFQDRNSYILTHVQYKFIISAGGTPALRNKNEKYKHLFAFKTMSREFRRGLQRQVSFFVLFSNDWFHCQKSVPSFHLSSLYNFLA